MTGDLIFFFLNQVSAELVGGGGLPLLASVFRCSELNVTLDLSITGGTAKP